MIALPGFRELFTRSLVTLGLLIALAPVVAAQQDPNKPPGPPEATVPKSTVKGRVIYDDTSQPVRRSPISLLQMADGPQQSSATDRDGRFVIKDVPAGVYFAFVNSPGIITPFVFMALTDKGPPDNLNRKEIREYCTEVVVDGVSDVEVVIHAHRGGAISGKVSYADGEPAINAEVSVIRRVGKQSTRVLTGLNVSSLLSLHTDDRGRYRVPGLPPGEYLVSAAENNTAPEKSGKYRGGGFDEFFKSDALTAAYYGGGTTSQDAPTVKIELGFETRDIDITLPDSTPHAISGSLIAHLDGIALPGATITIRNKDQANWFAQGAQQTTTDPQGIWTFENVPDGKYSISVEPPYGLPIPGAPNPATADNESEDEAPRRREPPMRRFVPKELEVTVAGADVASLAVELAEGASISGTVNTGGLENSYVMVHWNYEGSVVDPQNSIGAYDGTFSISGLRAGKVYLTADANTQPYGISGSEPARFYLKSITLNGVDLRKQPLVVTEGQTIKNVQITIAADLARAKIQLLDREGKPAPGKQIFVAPVDPTRWLFSGDIVSGTTDAGGSISFAGAPGEYFVMVVGPDDSWPFSADFIRSHAQTAPQIRLAAGDNKTVTVTAIP